MKFPCAGNGFSAYPLLGPLRGTSVSAAAGASRRCDADVENGYENFFLTGGPIAHYRRIARRARRDATTRATASISATTRTVGTTREDNIRCSCSARRGRARRPHCSFRTCCPRRVRLVTTSTKPDVLDATLAARSSGGRCHLFDPSGSVADRPGVHRLRWSPLPACTSWRTALMTARSLVVVGSTGAGRCRPIPPTGPSGPGPVGPAAAPPPHSRVPTCAPCWPGWTAVGPCRPAGTGVRG